MKKLFQENEEMRKNLKNFVENSITKLRWPLIAQQLETIYNITIDIPFELKQIYQDYCCPKPEIDQQRLDILMQIVIQNRCEMASIVEQFTERTGVKISCYLLTSKTQQFFKKAIERGIIAFLKHKSEQKKRLTNFPKANIVRLIRCLDLKPDDPHNQLVLEAAHNLKNVLLIYGKYRDADRPEYFEAIKEKMNRNQFYKTLLCLSFLDDLRMISQDIIQFDCELLPDYFLQDTIIKNKQLDVYQFLFVSDAPLKYSMYNNATHLEHDDNLRYYVQEDKFSRYKRLSKEAISEKPCKRSIQTVRGKVMTSTKSYPSKKTIKFNKELNSNMKEDNVQIYSLDIPFFQQQQQQ